MKPMSLMTIALVICTFVSQSNASQRSWIEGRDYTRLDAVQPTHVAAGKVEVLEVFSYACPYCNRFEPIIEELERNLPANAQMAFLPASFSAAEDMPMFQRAFFAAQALGVARRAHEAMYDAVWKTGELAVVDPLTNRLKSRIPTIEDAARCYGRLTGVKPEDFLRAARSFAVELEMRSADAQIIAMRVPGTPSLIVNGKYRIELDALQGTEDLIGIVKFLVSKESPRSASATPGAPGASGGRSSAH